MWLTGLRGETRLKGPGKTISWSAFESPLFIEVLCGMQLPKPEPLQHPPLPLDTSVSLEVGGGEVSQPPAICRTRCAPTLLPHALRLMPHGLCLMAYALCLILHMHGQTVGPFFAYLIPCSAYCTPAWLLPQQWPCSVVCGCCAY